MKMPLIFYLILLIIFSFIGFWGVDKAINAGKKNSNKDITGGGIFLAGLNFTLVFVGLTIYAFTGFFKVAAFFLILAALFLGMVYFFSKKNASDNSEIADEMFLEKKRMAQETAKKDPLNTAAWLKLAELAEEKEDYENAILCLRKVLKIENLQIHKDKIDYLLKMLKSGGKK